jgi:phosphorylcholine metabolism protein LicD
MTRLLAIFDAVCRKHDLFYAMIGGTLIGAIRHRGWIPWDMDVDVAVLQSELPQLKDALIKEIPPDVFYQDSETDPFYPAKFQILKLRDRYSNYYEWQSKHPRAKWHNGLQLDLFPYGWDEGEQHYVGPGALRCFRKEEMFPVKDMEFEGHKFRAPNDAWGLMVRVYGTLEMPSQSLRNAHEGKADPFHPCEHPASLAFGSAQPFPRNLFTSFRRGSAREWAVTLCRRVRRSIARRAKNKRAPA